MIASTADTAAMARIAVLYDIADQAFEAGSHADTYSAPQRAAIARWLRQPTGANADVVYAATSAAWRTPINKTADGAPAVAAMYLLHSAGLAIAGHHGIQPDTHTSDTSWATAIRRAGRVLGWQAVADAIAARWPEPLDPSTLRELLDGGLDVTAGIAACATLTGHSKRDSAD